MFDAEKLLGQLLTGGLGKRRRSRRDRIGSLGASIGGQLGTAAIGVAIAAFEHFMQGRKESEAATPDSVPNAPATPPPPPNAAPAVDPTLLIRVMIAAANADGSIDADEQSRILDQLGASGLDREERKFLLRELQVPRTIQELAAGVSDRRAAEAMYGAACMAIDADVDAERAFLKSLATALALDAATIAAIESQLK